MKLGSKNSGFTLIEMMLVLAIVVLLVSMIVGIAKRVDDQGKERLCRDTIALIGNALEQFRDFGYVYKHTDFAGLVFPLDCNGLGITSPNARLNLQTTLRDAIYPPAPTVVSVNIGGGTYDPNFSGSAAMYFILSQVPDCRTTLDKIDKSLLTNKGTDGNPINIFITINAVTTTLPFMRIIDPWGTTLRYDYYPEFADYLVKFPSGTWGGYVGERDSAKKTFPVITSAGPDKTFDTSDDITNIKQK
jgi:prepilin-type N-terminal cleavage/methylation domain-containing protein